MYIQPHTVWQCGEGTHTGSDSGNKSGGGVSASVVECTDMASLGGGAAVVSALLLARRAEGWCKGNPGRTRTQQC